MLTPIRQSQPGIDDSIWVMLRISVSGNLPDGETMNYYFKSLTAALVECFTEKRATLPSSFEESRRKQPRNPSLRRLFSFLGRRHGKRR